MEKSRNTSFMNTKFRRNVVNVFMHEAKVIVKFQDENNTEMSSEIRSSHAASFTKDT